MISIHISREMQENYTCHLAICPKQDGDLPICLAEANDGGGELVGGPKLPEPAAWPRELRGGRVCNTAIRVANTKCLADHSEHKSGVNVLWRGFLGRVCFMCAMQREAGRQMGKLVSRGVLRTISSQYFSALKFRSPFGSLRSSDADRLGCHVNRQSVVVVGRLSFSG